MNRIVLASGFASVRFSTFHQPDRASVRLMECSILRQLSQNSQIRRLAIFIILGHIIGSLQAKFSRSKVRGP